MKRLVVCLVLAGCVTPPETMIVTDPAGTALATVDFTTNEIRLTRDAMALLIPRPVLVPTPVPVPRRR